MALDELRDTVVHVRPELMRGDGPEHLIGDLDGEVQLPVAPRVDDGARGPAVLSQPSIADQKPRNGLDGLLRGAQSDPLNLSAAEGVEPFEGKRKVRTALVAGDGMDLIHDDRLGRLQHPSAALGREQDVKGFGRRDQDVRVATDHPLALLRRGVPRPDHHADLGEEDPE